jgi:hypothetical protein
MTITTYCLEQLLGDGPLARALRHGAIPLAGC